MNDITFTWQQISSSGVNTTMAIGTAAVYKDTNLHTHIQTNIDFALVWSQASWLGNGSSGHQRRVVFVYLLLLLFRLLIYCLYRSPSAQQPQNFKPPADQGDAYRLRHGSFANFNVSIMFVESNLCRLVLLSNFCIILPSYRTTKEYIQTDLIPFHCCNIGLDMPVHISASLKCLVGETQKYWSGGKKKMTQGTLHVVLTLHINLKFPFSFIGGLQSVSNCQSLCTC